jgi:hypothetical protein
VLREPGGTLVTVDLATGSRHDVTPAAPAWCRSLLQYRATAPYQAEPGESTTRYIGQYALYPCTAAGTQTPAPARIPSFVSQIGAQSGGLVAWSEKDAVVAAPTS